VLATADKNAREIPSTGKERVVPKILVPLVKVWQKSQQRLCLLLAGSPVLSDACGSWLKT
jgi:hypothetical protein